ncbi:hypothetical protein HYW74_04870 [Candidatus Pacearchaeota archaeon]|nr:hypothetical protein [Candidatus Pacearchaeota archaeon]
MISLRNKKGLESPSVGFVVGVVILLVLAVLIILYINGFFGTLNQAQGILTPETLSFFTQRCKTVAIDTNTYCAYEKAKLSKVTKEVLINCEFEDIQNALKQSNADYVVPFTCTDAIRNTLSIRACTDSPNTVIYIDGKLPKACKDVLAPTPSQVASVAWEQECRDLRGQPKDGTFCEGTERVVPLVINSIPSGKKCCSV